MDVIDQGGKPLQQITRHTRNARHIVSVENFSGLTQNARVTVKLPNLKLRLEYITPAAGGADGWIDFRSGIASGTTVDFVHRLRRTGGPNNPTEPIECADVEDSLGTLKFNAATCGVPFSMTIDAG
jgi:hypothetical protein